MYYKKHPSGHDFSPEVDFVTPQQLTWFARRWVAIISVLLVNTIYNCLAHLQWNSHQRWVCHGLEGNNNSWDGRSKWSETTVCTTIWHNISMDILCMVLSVTHLPPHNLKWYSSLHAPELKPTIDHLHGTNYALSPTYISLLLFVLTQQGGKPW